MELEVQLKYINEWNFKCTMKYKHIKQYDTTDCAAACLATWNGALNNWFV